MAAKLARLVYNMLRHGMEYVDRGTEFYEHQQRERRVYALAKNAAQLGFQLVPALPSRWTRNTRALLQSQTRRLISISAGPILMCLQNQLFCLDKSDLHPLASFVTTSLPATSKSGGERCGPHKDKFRIKFLRIACK
jgi:hypothetical protein